MIILHKLTGPLALTYQFWLDLNLRLKLNLPNIAFLGLFRMTDKDWEFHQTKIFFEYAMRNIDRNSQNMQSWPSDFAQFLSLFSPTCIWDFEAQILPHVSLQITLKKAYFEDCFGWKIRLQRNKGCCESLRSKNWQACKKSWRFSWQTPRALKLIPDFQQLNTKLKEGWSHRHHSCSSSRKTHTRFCAEVVLKRYSWAPALRFTTGTRYRTPCTKTHNIKWILSFHKIIIWWNGMKVKLTLFGMAGLSHFFFWLKWAVAQSSVQLLVFAAFFRETMQYILRRKLLQDF